MRKEVGRSCGRRFELSKRSGHTAGVVVIGVCVVVVLAGLVAVVRWGGLTVEPPRPPDPGDPRATRRTRGSRRRSGRWCGGTCGT